MGQFTPSYQPSFQNFSGDSGFSSNSDPGETPLGSGAPQGGSTSGFNGASLVQSNGNPLGGVYSQPGRFGNPNTPPPQNQSQFGNPGWKPSYNAPGGYNPLQYADDNTANQIAQGLGGTVERTKTLGPFGDFGQNQISFGNGNQLNAGLVGDRYSKYDRATADAMTMAERDAGPAVTNPNAGAIYLTGNPMLNPSQTPGYHPPTAPVTAPAQNPILGGPGSEPTLTSPQPAVSTQQPGGNQLMQLLQLLGMGGQQRAQNRQPYANSGYYPNLPRGGNQMGAMTPNGQFSVSQVINSGNAPARSNVGTAPTYNGTPPRAPNPIYSAPNGLTQEEYQNYQNARNTQLQQTPTLGSTQNMMATNGNDMGQHLLSLLLGF